MWDLKGCHFPISSSSKILSSSEGGRGAGGPSSHRKITGVPIGVAGAGMGAGGWTGSICIGVGEVWSGSICIGEGTGEADRSWMDWYWVRAHVSFNIFLIIPYMSHDACRVN